LFPLTFANIRDGLFFRSASITVAIALFQTSRRSHPPAERAEFTDPNGNELAVWSDPE
jgi:hypothetical protein